MKKKSGLGRNLNALLGGSEPRLLDDGEVELRVEKVLKQVDIDSLHPGQYQPRGSQLDEESLKELSQSIKIHGIIQPIVVRPLKGASTSFEIIAGERRWRAAKLAGLEQVPVVIKDIANQAALAIALIENIQREELNPLEEAQAYKRLLDEFDLTHQQISDSIGKSRTTITNMIRLLNLETEVREMLSRGDIELGHAKVLLSVHGQRQVQLAVEIINRNLTVREAERLIKHRKDDIEPSPPPKIKALDPNMQYFQERFENRLGVPVNINKNAKGGGKIVFEFSNKSDLEQILDRLST